MKTKKQQAERKAKAERVAALVARIRSIDGMARKVRDCYNGSQGNAETDAPEGSEAYEWAQHDHAIDAVGLLLADARLLVDGDDLEVVAEAYSEIS